MTPRKAAAKRAPAKTRAPTQRRTHELAPGENRIVVLGGAAHAATYHVELLTDEASVTVQDLAGGGGVALTPRLGLYIESGSIRLDNTGSEPAEVTFARLTPS